MSVEEASVGRVLHVEGVEVDLRTNKRERRRVSDGTRAGEREERTHLSYVVRNDRVSSVSLVDLDLSLGSHVVEAAKGNRLVSCERRERERRVDENSLLLGMNSSFHGSGPAARIRSTQIKKSDSEE